MPRTLVPLLRTTSGKQQGGCLGISTWCLHVSSLSRVRLFATPWTVALQAPLFTEFPRQEYWSELSFPPPRDLPHAWIELASLASPSLAGSFFTTWPYRGRKCVCVCVLSLQWLNCRFWGQTGNESCLNRFLPAQT